MVNYSDPSLDPMVNQFEGENVSSVKTKIFFYESDLRLAHECIKALIRFFSPGPIIYHNDFFFKTKKYIKSSRKAEDRLQFFWSPN